MNKYFLFALSLIISLTSCEEVINVDLNPLILHLLLKRIYIKIQSLLFV